MDGYEVGQPLTMLPCNHLFHTKCITRWLIPDPTVHQVRVYEGFRTW